MKLAYILVLYKSGFSVVNPVLLVILINLLKLLNMVFCDIPGLLLS